jgi:hypothetical protein
MRRRRWLAVTACVVGGGMIVAALAAGAVAGRDADRSRQVFVSSSAAVTSTLQLAIQHEEDLVVNAGAFILADPSASNVELARAGWGGGGAASTLVA